MIYAKSYTRTGLLRSFMVIEMTAGMVPYECFVCGYIYDPKIGDPTTGILPGVEFDALPDDWVCPKCGAGKDQFVKVQE